MAGRLIGLRLPPEAEAEIIKRAGQDYVGMATVVRQIVLRQLEKEGSKRAN